MITDRQSYPTKTEYPCQALSNAAQESKLPGHHAGTAIRDPASMHGKTGRGHESMCSLHANDGETRFMDFVQLSLA
jgi:hypothetical protein